MLTHNDTQLWHNAAQRDNMPHIMTVDTQLPTTQQDMLLLPPPVERRGWQCCISTHCSWNAASPTTNQSPSVS
jgi:hypothetical protein